MAKNQANHPLFKVLATRRKNVADYLLQKAIGFSTENNRRIEIEREEIVRIKRQLKLLGLKVDDDPIDEDEDESSNLGSQFGEDDPSDQNNREKATMTMEGSVDVVIITALPKESDAVLRHLKSVEETTVQNRTYYKSVIQQENERNFYTVVVLSLSGMGNTESAIATTQAITIWNPAQVILTGIAAGIKKGDSRFLGDLVVGEQIVGYELGRAMDGRTERRFQVLRPAHKLLEAARNLRTEEWVFGAAKLRPDGSSGRILPKVHFGVVASGEKVVADAGLVEELKSSWSQLVGIEMESYGTALAVFEAETVPGMLLVKGICDWADSSKSDDWQEYAADIAATFVVALLKRVILPKVRHQPVRRNPVKYSGKSKFELCKRLGNKWRDLALILDIEEYERARFEQGFECHGIWDWLTQRNKLDALEQALIDIDLKDLIEVLERRI
jgi:nucleoside phosphorylase